MEDSGVVRSQSFIPQGKGIEASARRKGNAGGQPIRDDDQGPVDQSEFDCIHDFVWNNRVLFCLVS